MGELIEGVDEFGKFWAKSTTNGRKIVKREVNGIEFCVDNPKTSDYMLAIQAFGAMLKRNVMNDKIDVNGREMSDYDLLIILNRLRDYGFRGETRLQDAIKEFAHRNKYHPIQDYLESLKWDGVSRWEELCTKITVADPSGYSFIRKWLIGSIAKPLQRAQNFMLVLVALQGKGKSRLARWVSPLANYFIEGAIDPSRADDHLRMISAWHWEVAELDATTRKADVAALKHFISQQVVRARAPYARMDTVKPATASLIGTVNPDGTGFLTDTENRRFAIVEIIDIDWSYTDIDIDQLWAELYHAYLNGESWELTQYEKEMQAEINSAFVHSSPIEMIFNRKFEIDPDNSRAWEVMDILDILEGAGLRGNQFTNSVEMGRVLSRAGAKPGRGKANAEGKRPKIWRGIRLKTEAEITL